MAASLIAMDLLHRGRKSMLQNGATITSVLNCQTLSNFSKSLEIKKNTDNTKNFQQ